MNGYAKKAGSLLVYSLAVVGGLVVLAVGGIAIAGYKHDNQERSEHFMEHMSEHVSDKLDLTDSQEDMLEGMLKEVSEKRRTLRKEAKKDIQALVMQDSMSQEDALKLLDMRKTRRMEMREFIASQVVAFHAELDADQKEELAEMAPRWLKKHGRKGKRKHGWGHGWGHGHGDRD